MTNETISSSINEAMQQIKIIYQVFNTVNSENVSLTSRICEHALSSCATIIMLQVDEQSFADI